MATSVQKFGPLPINRRGDLSDAICPSRTILDHLTSRWGMLIMIALLDGTHRFSELGRRVTGVSEKMLAQTLQALEADGFVLRTVYPTIPPRVEYSLTPMGREVAAHVKHLTDWVEDSVPKVMRAREKHLAKKSKAS
jgi:DNA-binding HxlR family transcriptional regulator